MSQIISTIMFNGQFWIALIEKYEEDGSLYIGKYTFGPEPTNTDLLNFYLNKSNQIKFYQSEQKVRVKKKYSNKELERNRTKSFENYKIEQKKYLIDKNKNKSKIKRQSQEEKYNKKILKKKDKKKGH